MSDFAASIPTAAEVAEFPSEFKKQVSARSPPAERGKLSSPPPPPPGARSSP